MARQLPVYSPCNTNRDCNSDTICAQNVCVPYSTGYRVLGVNVDYPRQDIRSFASQDPASCARMCNSLQQCSGFVHRANRCYLKREAAFKQPAQGRAGATSYRKVQVPQQQQTAQAIQAAQVAQAARGGNVQAAQAVQAAQYVGNGRAAQTIYAGQAANVNGGGQVAQSIQTAQVASTGPYAAWYPMLLR